MRGLGNGGASGIFDSDERLQALSAAGDRWTGSHE
jgi:hypothetical protein